jgi:hypothetical protein
MPSRLNTEFNYRTQVIGETVWEKIKTLKGFLEGRKRAAVLEQVGELKYQSKLAELRHLREIGGLEHIILNLEAEIMEIESVHLVSSKEAYELNRKEIATLEKLLAELYAVAEPTRLPGYSDDDMFELNSENEFAAAIAKEIQAEIIACGHPSPASIRNALRSPVATQAMQAVGLIPEGVQFITSSIDPLRIELK